MISDKASWNMLLPLCPAEQPINDRTWQGIPFHITKFYHISRKRPAILYLIDESEKELSEIEKIRLVNKKLKLFTPNTCPYCRR